MVKDAVLPDEELERLSLFLPIKVVNGFVSCDFMLGCYCCRFCLNRRYPDWNAMLDTGRVYRNGLDVQRALELLPRIKAFSRARVTLKVGHDTDMSLEEPQAQALVRGLPSDHPIVFMRRGRLPAAHRSFYMRNRPNLLMKLTLTPRSAFLRTEDDPFAILDSFRGIAQDMFFAVGPVCHDNQREAERIIRALPPGSRLWVRELIVKDVPGYDAAPPAGDCGGERLRLLARQQGHQVVNYLNCIVRSGLGLGFHKYGEFVSEPNAWQVDWSQGCASRHLCGAPVGEEEARARIDGALDELGLELELAQPVRKFGYKCYEVTVRQDVCFGDECYLRERSGLKTDLARQGRKTGTALSASIAQRWRERELFPVDELLDLARESYARVQAEICG